MNHKIKQQRAVSKHRSTFGRKLKSKSKITQFLVNRMIEKINQAENEVTTPSVFINSVAHDNCHNESQPLKPVRPSLIKTEQSMSKVDYVSRQTFSRSKEGNKDGSSSDTWKNYRAKKFKVLAEGEQQDFNSFITDRIRRLEKKKKKICDISDPLSGPYFGLNIIQIKDINKPQKESKSRQIIPVKMKPELAQALKQQESLQSKMDLTQSDPLQSSKQLNHFQSLEYSLNQSCGSIPKKRQDVVKHKKMRPKSKAPEPTYFQLKMQKMNECLDLILNSFHCCSRKQQPQPDIMVNTSKSWLQKSIVKPLRRVEKKKRYKFFIGSGNNGNLIRSLLHKRSWWVQVDTISKANFVWTQLRVPAVLQRLQPHNDDNWTNDIIFYEELNENVTANSSPMKQNPKRSNNNIAEDEKLKENALTQLFHERQSKRYHNVLPLKQAQSHLKRIQKVDLLHNHYEHNYMFGNKNALYYNLANYFQFSGQQLADIMPLTFSLEKGNKKGLAQFQRAFANSANKNAVWILKPAENSNRGNGIEVSKSLNEIKLRLNVYKKLIVQSYLQNLLLYNNRKFDIRTYMLSVTINGRHKFFWYEQGYLRTASQPYDLDNLKDIYVHLTNDAIQKHGVNYGHYEEGNKLSYAQFQRYLQNRWPKQQWQVSQLHQRMKSIAQQAVKATYCRIDPNRKKYSFQIFGLDFIVDSNFNPYLLEINTNPCLELSSAVLSRLIPRMLENAFRLAVDPLFRPCPGYNFSKTEQFYVYDQTFLQKNKFALIFDEKFDRHFQWEERCQKMRGIQWNQQQEEQYEDEGRLISVSY